MHLPLLHGAEVLPNVVRGELVGEHGHHLGGQGMRRAQDDVGIARLHVLGVHVDELLFGVGVDVLPAGQLHEAAHVAVRRGHHVRAGNAHQDEHRRRLLAFVSRAILLDELGVLANERLGLLLAAELLAQVGDGVVHALHAAQVEEHRGHHGRGVLRLQIALQRVGREHVVGTQRFQDLQVGSHGRAHLVEVGVAFGQAARRGGHAHEVKLQLVADLGDGGRGGHDARLVGAVLARDALGMLVDAPR